MLRVKTKSSSRSSRFGKRRRNSYGKMMKTLLLQNQQIIIQQQNMMFMVVKQFQNQSSISNNIQSQPASQHQHNHHLNNNSHQHPEQQQQQQQQQQHQHHHHHQQQQQQHQHSHESHQLQHHNSNSSNNNINHQIQHHSQLEQSHQIHQLANDQSVQSHQIYNGHRVTTSSSSAHQLVDTEQQLQQVASQLQDSLAASSYLTPAASEQDPICDKQDDDELVALLEGDGLLHSNLLYNPATDIGSITPYKSLQQQQTPSYYSSGCESLTTPRVEPQRQPTNISQNVVKNLADSFKSPTKPKINVQIMSGTATGSMKNSKAKIIQRMNISEFLRHVHPETDEVTQKHSSQ